jgi:hypothetical protein
MFSRTPSRFLFELAAFATASFLAAQPADAAEATAPATSPAALIAEARSAFTLNGKKIPPEIFRDFGDGDMADSGSIWVTVDLLAAIGSNLYFDDIAQDGHWISQAKQGHKGSEGGTAYKYIGATENGLLVALSAWSGGGSGDFITLHILDIAPARAFDIEGKLYQRINLTNLRNVPLGDRWDGEVSIEKNSIVVVTKRSGPADDSGQRRTMTIEAKRP